MQDSLCLANSTAIAHVKTGCCSSRNLCNIMCDQHQRHAFLYRACRKTQTDTVKAMGMSNQELCDDQAYVTLLPCLHLKQERFGGQNKSAQEKHFFRKWNDTLGIVSSSKCEFTKEANRRRDAWVLANQNNAQHFGNIQHGFSVAVRSPYRQISYTESHSKYARCHNMQHQRTTLECTSGQFDQVVAR